MPGKSYGGPPEPLTEAERVIRDKLYGDIRRVTHEIGERNLQHYDALMQSAAYIRERFEGCGYEVRSQPFTVEGRQVENIEAEIRGQKPGILVVGAHYDSVFGTRGANDNGTGVAALLVLAGELRHARPENTIRFVAFVNEEPPYSYTENMGSLVCAKQCKERGENIIGMISLETIGYFSDKKGSQSYPFPMSAFYPNTGNFIGFVGNTPSSDFLLKAITSFRKHARFPSEGGIMPTFIPQAGWSDHWSFWQMGYPAFMITDTAPFRYPFYHMPEDTMDKICFDPFAKVVSGLLPVLMDLVA